MTKEFNIKTQDRFDQASVQFETILHLGGMLVDGDNCPEPLEDLIKYNLDKGTVKELQKGLPWLKKLDLENLEPWAFIEQCFDNGTLGFLVNVQSPVIKDMTPDGKSWSGGYGLTNSRWFYGETFQEVVDDAEKWGKQRYRDAVNKAKQLAAAKPFKANLANRPLTATKEK